MKKEALAAAISRRSRFSLTDVTDLLTVAFDEIGNALGKGEQVRLGHIGMLKPSRRAAGKGRNVQTGEVIVIPAKRTVTFKPFKKLKETLNRE